ncbi:MFS transporter, OFA family, oxalate/formate antiporter [Microlunatus sagamiharensis]|uniref:MFS transporter, OFA family, oxalate/formate antiporter n=1 Tax=Microlunatus sagamiharensis TaxID=546874 RepID=A0A1H2LKM1_9ACTN|nr:OFA family MFS transporter [Microlunatus sagamiharensis]SDU81402.1 MFS transporter, OFA family, oxalate/formate antiporter [Microlunatus sagamiharensis]
MSTASTPTATAGDNPTRGRVRLVVAALLLQLAIGAVYAWSVFAKALQGADAWKLTKVQASIPFEVTIGVIFFGTYIGGRIQDRRGPRLVALVGGVLYSIGVILASFARGGDQLWLLVLGYGVIGGFGLGLAYIVPIAMLQKWFPDRRGLITGLAVGGFGFGAVLTAPVAQRLIAGSSGQPTAAFLPLGIAYLVLCLVGASQFKNPPEGYTVPGFVPKTTGRVVDSGRDYAPGEAMRTWQWYALTAILTLAVLAGISLISQAAASFTDIAGYSAIGAASAVGFLGLFNGGGRIFWAAISERIGRMTTFVAILAIEGVCLLVLPHVGNAVLFFVLAALIYLCYGGSFGTMPATAGDFFGVKFAGAIYGLMLIAWSLGGVVGPLITASLIGPDKAYTTAYTVIGIIALVGVVLPLITRIPRTRKTATEGSLGAEAGATGR